ncbi:centrosomal AT-AC splicing factor-like [Glandiceps talaboti]
MSAADVQTFQFCEVCRRNHDQGRKHIYTKRHADRIKLILQKLKDKVKTAKAALREPSISSEQSLHSVKCWCYICSEEVPRHAGENKNIIFKEQGLIYHLASSSHLKKAVEFLWNNKLDKNQMNKFILTEEHCQKWKESKKIAQEIYVRKQEQDFEEKVKKQTEIEARRLELLTEVPITSQTLLPRPYYKSQHMILPSTSCIQTQSYNSNGSMIDTQTTSTRFNDGHSMYAAPCHQSYAVRNNHETMGFQKYNPRSYTVMETTSNDDEDSSWPTPCTTNNNKDRKTKESSNKTSTLQSSTTTTITTSTTTDNVIGVPSNRTDAAIGVTNHSEHRLTEKSTLGNKRTTNVKNTSGLTAIHIQDDGTGNIHTGALPPWLQDDDEGDDEDNSRNQQVIGPTEEDYKKHLERQRKRKLPPDRVGANFDHSLQTNDQWLPSFGRVWNSGRRWQSRHEYRREDTASKRRKHAAKKN